MLKLIRRHAVDCSQYGKRGTECPSKKKNKCPFIVYWWEDGKRKQVALDTKDEETASVRLREMEQTGVKEVKLPEPPPKFKTVQECNDAFLAAEAGRGIQGIHAEELP
jgi:hypothetical protein